MVETRNPVVRLVNGWLFSVMMLLQACARGEELPAEPIVLDGAELHYTSSRCFGVHPGLTADLPADTLWFKCGYVVVEFGEGTRWTDVRDLLKDLGGPVVDWFPGGGEQVLRVIVGVPVGSEKRAIEKARADQQTQLASLCFHGIGGVV